MPELPDVEIFKKYFDSTSLHQHISKVTASDSRLLQTGKQKIIQTLEGHSFGSTRRVGKYLFAEVKSGRYLVLHFGMTGYLKYYKNETEKPDYIQLLVSFSNEFNLAYISKRKLGKLDIAENIDTYCRKNSIGPDVFEIDKDQFIEGISGKKGKIKSALMDQELFSGLGNVYVDEILYQARVHPEVLTTDLDKNQWEKIHSIIHRVLQTAIRNEADPGRLPDQYLLPHRQEGEKCPACDGRIKKIKVNGRGTYFCPDCQRK